MFLSLNYYNPAIVLSLPDTQVMTQWANRWNFFVHTGRYYIMTNVVSVTFK